MHNEAMDYGNLNNKEMRLKALLENFFDASISPEEMQELSSAARSMTSMPPGSISDPGLISDLRLINEFSQFASDTLSRNAASTPDDLEERLSAHISSLAASSRSRYAGWRKILSACAAAAVVMLTITGVRFISSDSGSGLPVDSRVISLAKTAPEAAEPVPAAPLPLASAETAPHTATASPAAASVSTVKATLRNVTTSASAATPVTPALSADFESEAELAINSIPDFTDDAMRVMPAGIIAEIDPSEILLQPMTTLSQTIDNIYESVAIVSEALSGVGMALQTVNTSLADLNSPI